MNWSMIGVLFGISTTILNVFMILLIKMNDLKHLEKNMDKLLTSNDDVVQRLSRMEGVLLASVKSKRKKE